MEEKEETVAVENGETERETGTPLESEQAEVQEEKEAEEEDDSSDDDIQITIGEVKANVAFQKLGGTAQKGQKGGAPKLDIDATAEIDGTQIYDLDLASMEDKPWRKPGADITDYFNYGFTEETWNMYCERQRKLRSEYASAAANKMIFSSLVIGQSSISRVGAGKDSQQIINLADKSKQQQQTPIFRKLLTPSGQYQDLPLPQTLPTVNLAAPKVTTSIPVLGGPPPGLALGSSPNLSSLMDPPSFDETEGPPGESPQRQDNETPPPGVEGDNFRNAPVSSQQQRIQSISVVNMSVPPPGFSRADTTVPPPGFGGPRPFPPPGMHPTNIPPPGIGGFNPPPPGVQMIGGGRGGFQYRPMGPRPNVMRAYAGFGNTGEGGDRSPASYSDQDSDMDDRDRDRDRRHRRDMSYRGRRRSPSPDRRRREPHHRSRYERSPERDRRSRRRGSNERDDERRKDEKRSTSKRSTSRTKNTSETPDDEESKEKRRKRRRDDEEQTEEGKKKVKEEPKEDSEKEKEEKGKKREKKSRRSKERKAES